MNLVHANSIAGRGVITRSKKQLAKLSVNTRILFTNGYAFAGNIEEGHCSNHVYYSTGCLDCDANALLGSFLAEDDDYFGKTQRIHEAKIDVGNPSPRLQLIRQQFKSSVTIFLANAGDAAAKAVSKKMRSMAKALDSDEEAIFQAAFDAVQWEELVDASVMGLGAAAQSGGVDGLMQMEVTESSAVDAINTVAANYASRRAAEMVGKKWVGDKLIDNPDARFVIADTTRDDLRDIIERAFLKQSSVTEIIDAIRTAGSFSPKRAEMIERYEISAAQVQGNLEAWRSTGLVKTVRVALSANHVQSDECDAIAAGGPYPINQVPMIPAHPFCECLIHAETISEPS